MIEEGRPPALRGRATHTLDSWLAADAAVELVAPVIPAQAAVTPHLVLGITVSEQPQIIKHAGLDDALDLDHITQPSEPAGVYFAAAHVQVRRHNNGRLIITCPEHDNHLSLTHSVDVVQRVVVTAGLEGYESLAGNLPGSGLWRRPGRPRWPGQTGFPGR